MDVRIDRIQRTVESYNVFSSSFLVFFAISRQSNFFFFFYNNPAPTDIYPLPLHDALPIYDETPRLAREIAELAASREERRAPFERNAKSDMPLFVARIRGSLHRDVERVVRGVRRERDLFQIGRAHV